MKKVSNAALLVSLIALLSFGAANAQEIKSRTIKFAMQTNPGTAQYDGAGKFAELVGKKSGGKIKAKVFAGGALGGDIAVFSSLQGGTVEVSQMNASLLSGVGLCFSYPLAYISET
jgi:TRAP-type C4-dicarboxylate transport system substrate-binding protein